MSDRMEFPDTVEEYMEKYKIVDTEQIYTNGADMVPIFRMKQWFEHESERKTGKWRMVLTQDVFGFNTVRFCCSKCNGMEYNTPPFCRMCGAKMEEGDIS